MSGKDVQLEKAYWDKFYSDCVIDVPSQFCVSMATDVHTKKAVVEFGMGNGRDSLYLAGQGFIVVGVDISSGAVSNCEQAMAKRGVRHATFLCGDITTEETVEKAIGTARELANDSSSGLIIYSRFVIHSLDDAQEKLFLTSL